MIDFYGNHKNLPYVLPSRADIVLILRRTTNADMRLSSRQGREIGLVFLMNVGLRFVKNANDELETQIKINWMYLIQPKSDIINPNWKRHYA